MQQKLQKIWYLSQNVLAEALDFELPIFYLIIFKICYLHINLPSCELAEIKPFSILLGVIRIAKNKGKTMLMAKI